MAPTREELRLATRERVLTAADRLFQERGYDSATVRDIAEASGVSVGSVMATGDKDELLVQVFDSLIERGHVRQHPDPAGKTCADRILDLVTPFVTLFVRRQDLARVYASIQVSGKKTSPLFTGLAALLLGEIGTTITRQGCTPAEGATSTAQAIYFAYIGTLFSWSARENIEENDLTDSLRVTFAAICTCREQS